MITDTRESLKDNFYPKPLLSFQREDLQHYNLHYKSSLFERGEINTEKRTDFNDIFTHITNNNTIDEKEEKVEQKYRLEYFKGSTFIGSEGFSGNQSLNEFNITIISQTSYFNVIHLLYRSERLFYIPHLLKRWNG